MTRRMLTPKPYNPPHAEALKVIHIDDAIAIIDKPSGLLSVPGRGAEKAVCAVSRLTDLGLSALTVHRLDMDTSGIMVFAQTKAAQKSLSRQFEDRHVSKIYHAVVVGEMDEEAGTIDAAIARFSKQRPLRHLDPEGRSAITHWQVLERCAGRTRLCLKPETGRSHQLRLHLASIGHPIVGDVFYGHPDPSERLHLHAQKLTLKHPETGHVMDFESPAPF